MHDHPSETQKPASHRSAIFILIAIFVCIAFFGWQALRTRQLTISSISKPGEYRLSCSRIPPSSRWIHVTGWIDGTANLELTGGVGPVAVEAGNVEWKLAGHWTEGDCILKYSPGTARTGKLTVEYRIE